MRFVPSSTASPDPSPPVYAPPTVVPVKSSPLVHTPSSDSPGQDPHLHQTSAPATTSASVQPGNNEMSLGPNSTGSTSTSTTPANIEVTHTQPSAAPQQTQPSPESDQTQPNPAPAATLQPLQPNLPSPQSSTSTDPPPNAHPMTTRSKNQITKPVKKLTLTAVTTSPKHTIPKTVAQAMRDEKWRQAMSSEYNAQLDNHTFELVPPPSNHRIIDTRWIHTIKYSPNGDVRRYKSRWVARGYNQEYGIDYGETFSPVVKSITIRLVLHLAVTNSWQLKQLDVNNAFLQGTLTDEVYVTQPPGFEDPDRPHHVCRLRKALYGLKQAPRAWYQELKTFLCQMGCYNSAADTSVFIYVADKHVLYILVYVDDIIVTGSSYTMISACINVLSSRFSLKDPTDLDYFLGIEVTRTTRGLHLMQRKYVIDLLTKMNMLDAKPVSTPLPTTPKLTLTSGFALDNPQEYRMVVGSLQYLAFTRPDIVYSVNKLSQFMHKPTDEHWKAAKRILRYLAGTLSHGIYISKFSPNTLHAYSDADWAGDTDDYISTNAYIVYMGSTPIAWSSRKQTGVARSSTEAEYRSVANTATELSWVCSLLTELGVTLTATPTVYCDNVGATYLSANPVFHSKMKHLALDFHFVRNNVQSGALRVTHVSTKDQLADALTKPLPRTRFHELINKIGVTNLPPS